MDVSKLENAIGKPVHKRRRPEGFGITISEYMKLYDCTKSTAKSMLDSGVDKGALLKEEMIANSSTSIVYYLNEK